MPKLWKVIQAVYRREPLSHIRDLWGLYRGKLEVRGNPPNQYLMEVRKGRKSV